MNGGRTWYQAIAVRLSCNSTASAPLFTLCEPRKCRNILDSPTALAIAQVELRFLKDGQQVENVFHVAALSPLAPADAQDIYSTVDAWVKQTLRPTQTNDTTYTEVVIQDVNPNGPRYVFAGDGQPGAITNSQAPDNVTIALKKNSALSGRHYRGRFYHIGLSVNWIANSRINPANLFTLVSTYEALRTGLAAKSFPMVVAYRDTSRPHPRPIIGGVQVTSITASDNIVDSQRRRLPGRGR